MRSLVTGPRLRLGVLCLTRVLARAQSTIDHDATVRAEVEEFLAP